MSIATHEPTPETEARCAHCGTALQEAQEWCLECGAARTLLHRAPDWRIPLAIVGGVIVLALGGLAFALIKLSSDANRSAASIVPVAQASTPAVTSSAGPGPTTPSPPTTPATTSTPASKKTPTSTTPTATTAASPNGQFVSWPVGLGGFTVSLFSSSSQAAADAAAAKVSATVPSIGVLNSSQHPSMTPGLWVVFAGRYRTKTLAQAAAARLVAAGRTQARAELVAPL